VDNDYSCDESTSEVHVATLSSSNVLASHGMKGKMHLKFTYIRDEIDIFYGFWGFNLLLFFNSSWLDS